MRFARLEIKRQGIGFIGILWFAGKSMGVRDADGCVVFPHASMVVQQAARMAPREFEFCDGVGPISWPRDPIDWTMWWACFGIATFVAAAVATLMWGLR